MPETVLREKLEFDLLSLPKAAEALLHTARNRPIWLFYGELGAGKTTLIKGICNLLGVSGDVLSSPTYSIINEYSFSGGTIYHFDFYRIRNEMEIFDLGVEEYFDSGNYCFVEWPEKLESLIPSDYFKIVITDVGNMKRCIEYEKHA